MVVEKQDFEMYQCEDKVICFDITDGDDNPKSLTGSNALWVVYSSLHSTNKIEKKSTDGEITFNENEARVILVPDDTKDLCGRFYHELRIILGDSSEVCAVGHIVINNSKTGS